MRIRPRGRTATRAARRAGAVRRLGRHRQPQARRRAFARLALQRQRAAELPREPVRHRQAEARALAAPAWWRRMARSPWPGSRVHARAGVGDLDAQVGPGPQLRRSAAAVRASTRIRRWCRPSGMASRALMARFSTASSTWWGSTSRGRQVRRDVDLQLDLRADRALQQLLHAEHQRAEIGRCGAQLLLARKGQHALRQRGAAGRRPASPPAIRRCAADRRAAACSGPRGCP